MTKSKYIDEEQLLKVMPHADLLEVQALLHKRLGDHKAALRWDKQTHCSAQCVCCTFKIVMITKLLSDAAMSVKAAWSVLPQTVARYPPYQLKVVVQL